MMNRVICFFLLGVVAAPAQAQYDTYGGWLKLKGRKTGFFHTERVGGRWWLVTPEGNVFFSKGVCADDMGQQKKSSPEDFTNLARQTARQLREWNFNTVACSPWPKASYASPWRERGGSYVSPMDTKVWSFNIVAACSPPRLPGMAYTVSLGLAASTQPDVWLMGIVPDYFSPEFREAVDRAAKRCTAFADDPWLIGYFTDNELRWSPDLHPERRLLESVLELYLKKPPESPGYQRAVAFLKARGHAPDSVTPEDRVDFLEIAAAEYGRICHDAIRRYDPNHLILGCRFANAAPLPLARTLGQYFDVVSFNSYQHRAPLYELRKISEVSRKPTLISEFSFKAMDSGLPNTNFVASKPVATQQDRADLFAAYVQDLASLSSCVGFHWFQYRDMPKEGRPLDGENGNYGLVKRDGTPWTVLTKRMTEVNAGIEALAAKSGKR